MEEKLLDRLLIFFSSLSVIVSLFIIFTIDVHATSDYHNVITTAIYTGTQHCLSPSVNGLCVSTTYQTGDQYIKYTFGDDDFGVLSINFVVNTAIRSNSHATIRLTATNWANVSYTCMSSHFSCRVVRANHNILNINFDNTASSNVTGAQFFIQANGSILNGNETFNVSKADLYETTIEDSSNNTGSGSGGTYDSTGDIINNQNQNTQDIIDNNNSNTQDIINNQNQNTQDIIDNQSSNATCPSGPLQLTYSDWAVIQNKKLLSTGEENSNSTSGISPYFIIRPGETYNFIYKYGSYSGSYYCFYDSSKTLISCSPHNNDSTTFVPPNNATYLRVSLSKTRSLSIKGPICNDWEKEKLDELNNTQKETNDLIKDDSVDQSQANDFFSSFSTSDNGGISSIITKPLVIVNNLLSNVYSCSNLQLPSFMGATNVYLPSGCILWDRAPSSVTRLWNIFVCGVACYYILKDLFKIIEDLKNPDNDKVEVMDL